MRAIIRRSPIPTLRIVDPFLDEFERLAGEIWDSWQPAVLSLRLPRIPDLPCQALKSPKAKASKPKRKKSQKKES